MPQTSRPRKSIQGQRKSIPKPKLSDPFADLWKCSAFAILTQGCTASEVTSDIAEMHARIHAVSTSAAGGQTPSQAIPKPIRARKEVKKRAIKPTSRKLGSVGLRKSSKNETRSRDVRIASGGGARARGTRDTGEGPQAIGTRENGDKFEEKIGGYEGGRTKVISDPTKEENEYEIWDSITVAETDRDEMETEGGGKENINNTIISDSEGFEDEEIQESITVATIPRDVVSNGIYLGGPREKRQS